MLNDTLLEITQRLAKVGGWSVTLGDKPSIYWTGAAREILGFDLNMSLSLELIASCVLPDQRERVLHTLAECRTSGIPCDEEFEVITPQGERKWIHLLGQAELSPTGKVQGVVGAIQDITQEKVEARANRVLSERLLNMLEHMSDAFYLLDTEWRLVYVNRAADKLMKQDRVTGLGKNIWDLFPHLIDTPLHAGYLQAVRDNKPFHTEYFSQLMQNWIGLDAYPSPEGLAVYFQSITERKLMQERLDQAQHMESIGKLTGHVAHDFNNLLTVILGNAELLKELQPQDAHAQRVVANIHTAALKGSELTRRLLSYARKQTLAPRAIDINHLVSSMRELLVRTLGVNITIDLAIQPRLPPALVDEHQLEGALLNLALNARDAMPKGGVMTISTSDVIIDAAEASRHPEFKVGHYIRLSVTDTGVGISPEHVPQVFEPYFTTKEQGKGTGLGLSSVIGFAKQSNGHVSLASQVGVGTNVDLYLPVTDSPISILEEPVDLPSGGSETILVVDDDEMVRNAAHAVLSQRLGYQVLAVSNGETALSVLKSNTNIDLMFSDVMMPGMNGHELARQARSLLPNLRVLLTSGFVNPSFIKSAADAEFPLLPKPYSQQQLAQALREVLDRTH